MKANVAEITIPAKRNGSAINQIKGKSTSASKATGQHKTNRMQNPTNNIRTFMMIIYSFLEKPSTVLKLLVVEAERLPVGGA